jgi:hypothetical protein
MRAEEGFLPPTSARTGFFGGSLLGHGDLRVGIGLTTKNEERTKGKHLPPGSYLVIPQRTVHTGNLGRGFGAATVKPSGLARANIDTLRLIQEHLIQYPNFLLFRRRVLANFQSQHGQTLRACPWHPKGLLGEFGWPGWWGSDVAMPPLRGYWVNDGIVGSGRRALWRLWCALCQA